MIQIGAGYLDAWAALNSTDTLASGMAAPSPTAVFDASSGKVSVVNANTAVSGTTAVYRAANRVETGGPRR